MILIAQYLYPVLHEPSFNAVVVNVYSGSTDPYDNFSVRLVIAISMQKLDSTYAGLADSYYLAALPYLDEILIKKDLGTLQCLLLIAMYSMTTPTRTAAYWVVGLAAKLCQELNIADESTIRLDKNNQPLDTLEIDLRRRCYWVSLSFELGMAHILGRPSSFAISYDHVDVKSWQLVDDKYISREGINVESPVSIKKQISSHFMLMRLLQLEIRHTLYVRKRKAPADDTDPWFAEMERKLHAWVNACPSDDEGSGITQIWFKARLNTMVVFLFRPSPQVPEPSTRAAEECFEASRFNIYAQKRQIESKSIDITWMFGQALFMAINTILWTLSYPSIRKAHPKAEVEQHLQAALEAIYIVSRKWPGVESALDLYMTLADTCLKAYESVIKPVLPTSTSAYKTEKYTGSEFSAPDTKDTRIKQQTADYKVQNHCPSPRSTTPSFIKQETSDSDDTSTFMYTPPTQPAEMARQYQEMTYPYGSSPTSSISSIHYQQQPPTSNPYGNDWDYQNSMIESASHHSHTATTPPSSRTIKYEPIPRTVSYSPQPDQADIRLFDPGLYSNPLPGPLDYTYPSTALDNILDGNMFYGSSKNPCAQLLHVEYFDPGELEGLDLKQQSELLGNLEANGLGGEFQYTHTPSPRRSGFPGG